MLLTDLLSRVATQPGFETLELSSNEAAVSTSVESIELDSRSVRSGTLFACVPGQLADGHDFAATAVAKGAVALLCERSLGVGALEIVVPSTRAALGPLSSAFNDDPSSKLDVVGVTGTNGKTTVTHLLAAIVESAGRRCGLIGTLSGTRTTPEAPELQNSLAQFVADGREVAAIEVSSHALAQQRVDGTRLAVAAFTNLSQDHLDYHGTMSSYFQAKARLFEAGRAERAVVCTDDAHGRLLLDAAQVPTIGYSLADASEVVGTSSGSDFLWRRQRLHVGLAGRFNLANAICAATIASELGVTPEQIAAGLEAAEPVSGRFELIDEGQPFQLLVDYAHTPDGLVQVLGAARDLAADNRVLVVFGCGGERDSAKRPMMGEVAAKAADLAIVTNDNPRSEDPAAIIDAVLSGIPDESNIRVIPDRRAAIASAIDEARPGDVVVLAGKGHETTQQIGDEIRPFDDRQVAREELAR